VSSLNNGYCAKQSFKLTDHKNVRLCGLCHKVATTPRTESFLLPRAGRLFFKKEALSLPYTIKPCGFRPAAALCREETVHAAAKTQT
jgi:hypothetical protein